MKTWHKFIALGVIAVSAYWWGQRGQREDIDQLRSSVRSVNQSLQDTNRAVAQATGTQLRVALAETRTAGSAPASGAAPAQADPELPAAATAAEPAKPASIDPATLREHLTTKFDGQVRDAQWSSSAGLLVHSKLSALMPQPSALKAVDCKQTMCRIEMEYDDLAHYQAFLRQVTPDALPWNGTFFSTIAGDPTARPITFVAFLSREGEQLAVD